MKIQTKIRLAMSAGLLVGVVFATAGTYSIVTRNTSEDCLRNARTMMEAVNAVRTYTSENISPLLQQQMKFEFLPSAIPPLAAQAILRPIQHQFAEYNYREPTSNPTNPSDKPREWEADVISEFRDHPDKTEIVVMRETPAGQMLVLARPLKIVSDSCLLCHGTVEKAPPTMTALYGIQNGFGWKLGDIVGAQIVSMPLAVLFQRAQRTFLLTVTVLAAAFVSAVGLIYLAVSFIIAKPITKLSDIASQISLGKSTAPDLMSRSRDEIGSLAASFNRMRRSLQESLKMLETQR
jgi:HAMP domain-containing protein